MANLKECIEFANEARVCFLATADGDQPRVRALQFWFADPSGFYLQTGTVKAFYGQLKKNPKTEVCFFKAEPNGAGKMLRVTGKVEFLQDRELKEQAIIDRPFLKSFGLTADSPDLVIFRIPHGEAHFWTMETNLMPKDVVKF